MDKINITGYKNNGVSFSLFQNDLIECLGDSIFTFSKTSLCFHVIKCFDYDFKHKPGIHKEDVEIGCADVKQLFISQFHHWEENISTIKNSSIFELFLYNLLNLERLPGHEFALLDKKVKEDLEKRNETIEFYSSLKYIRGFKANSCHSQDS